MGHVYSYCLDKHFLISLFSCWVLLLKWVSLQVGRGKGFWYCWTTGCNISYGFSSRRIVDDCVGGSNVNFMHVMFCGNVSRIRDGEEGIGQINYYIKRRQSC